MQCIVPCMHFQPFQRHQGFKYTVLECPNIIRNKPVLWPKEPVCSSDVFPYVDLACNHYTQYLLAILCVLVYIFLKSGLIFSWKWILFQTFFSVLSVAMLSTREVLTRYAGAAAWRSCGLLSDVSKPMPNHLTMSNALFQSVLNWGVEKLVFIFATIGTYVCAMKFQYSIFSIHISKEVRTRKYWHSIS